MAVVDGEFLGDEGTEEEGGGKSVALVPVSRGMLVEIARPACSITDAHAQIIEIRKFIKGELEEGIDYGKFKDSDKKHSLLLPGAQKIGNLYGIRPRYSYLVSPIIDWERGIIDYEIRCELIKISTNQRVGEGVGTCNSRESKYRYRWIEEDAPSKEEALALKSKGLGKWQKWGGRWVWLRKTDNPDIFDLKNTILKMAKKRAFLDSIITMSRIADMFTQDLEDDEEETGGLSPYGDEGEGQEGKNKAKSKPVFRGQGKKGEPPPEEEGQGAPPKDKGNKAGGSKQAPKAAPREAQGNSKKQPVDIGKAFGELHDRAIERLVKLGQTKEEAEDNFLEVRDEQLEEGGWKSTKDIPKTKIFEFYDNMKKSLAAYIKWVEEEDQEGESQEGESQEGESQEGESQEGESQEGESQEGESQEGESQEGEAPPSKGAFDDVEHVTDEIKEAFRGKIKGSSISNSEFRAMVEQALLDALAGLGVKAKGDVKKAQLPQLYASMRQKMEDFLGKGV